MATTRVVLFCVVLVSYIFHTGESIQCYLCNSSINPNCTDVIDKDVAIPVTCSSAYQDQLEQDGRFVCQKIKVTDSEGRGLLMRGCSVLVGESNPCDIAININTLTGGAGKLESCEICDQDHCNA